MESDGGNTAQPKLGDLVSTKHIRIAELAAMYAGEPLNNLQRFIDISWLEAAYQRTRKDGAPGVDDVTWEIYGQDLDRNLADLLLRIKRNIYRAPPVRRAYIPKGGSKEKRPIGIPTLEDRVAQRAVVMLLEPIVEREFYDGSFGFRRGRSAHQALRRLRTGLENEGTQWLVEVDIRKFFDTIDHAALRHMVQQRVSDGVVTRLIDIWLKAGVLEEGIWHHSDEGTPQGGVISPLLANIFLHEVLDTWLETTARPYMTGRYFWVRFADDFVIGCETRHDADMLLRVLPKRFGKYGLALHPDKTRLVPFGRPVHSNGTMRDGTHPGSFDFLGFRHTWVIGRNGRYTVRRKTSPPRFTRAIRAVDHWLKRFRHLPTEEQHRALFAKVNGHQGYYAIQGNYKSIKNFCYEALLRWKKWLNRRGNRTPLTWAKFWRGVQTHFAMPRTRIVHPKY